LVRIVGHQVGFGYRREMVKEPFAAELLRGLLHGFRETIYKPQLGCEMLCDHHETSEIGNTRALFEYNSDFDVSCHNAPSGALPIPDHR
jgi:hypothetical protein